VKVEELPQAAQAVRRFGGVVAVCGQQLGRLRQVAGVAIDDQYQSTSEYLPLLSL
jgi:hypothetical protein